MKTILLLVSGLFLISPISFGKELNIKALEEHAIVRNFESDIPAYKNSRVSKSDADERNRIWLNLTNAGGAFKQSLVGYVTGATNGLDKLYDGVSLDTNPYIDFYSINGGKNLTIQGRGLPFVITDEVPFGYKTTIAGAFEISLDHVDGFFVTQDIFLKDLTTGVIHNLKNGSYSFTTLEGRFNDRFLLLYVDNTPEEPIASEETDPIIIVPEIPIPIVTEPEITDPIVIVPEVPIPIVTEPEITDPVLTVPEVPVPIVTVPEVTDPIATVFEVSDLIATNGTGYGGNGKGKSVFVSVDENEITVSSADGSINEIFIYSMGQRQLFERKNINNNKFVIPDLGVASQVLIIKTQLKNGKWASSKIVLKQIKKKYLY